MRCKAIVITVFVCLNLGAIVQPGGCFPTAPLDDAFVEGDIVENADNDTLPGDTIIVDQDNRPQGGGTDLSSDGDNGSGGVDEQIATLAASVSPGGGFAPAILTFRAVNGTRPSSGQTFEWDFGDGATAVGSEVQHGFGQAGIYTVRVAQYVGGLVFNSQSLVVPVISDVTPTYTKNNLTVEFVAETGSLQPWMGAAIPHWDFGDGDTAEGWSVTHTFRKYGTHTVNLSILVASVSIACSPTTVVFDAPSDPLPPVASVGEDQSQTDSDGDGFALVVLSGSASYDPDGEIVEYRWSEGSGVLQTGANDTLIRQFAVGSHQVELRVTDTDGFTDTDVAVITVLSGSGGDPTNTAPVADAGADQEYEDSTKDGWELATLDGRGSRDPDGSIVSYRWYQGSTLLATSAFAMVAVPLGATTVTLEVTDNLGAQATDTVLVTVTEPSNHDPSAMLDDNFESYAVGGVPGDWFATGANNSLSAAPNLYTVSSSGGSRAFGTSDASFNTHTHFNGAGASDWTNYEFSGRVRLSDIGGGVGVTLFSAYPSADKYYKLRTYWGNAFELDAHGTSLSGNGSLGVVPQANTWYRFRIQAEDAGGVTHVRARVWAASASEPSAWQVDLIDNTATRLTKGTVGIWAMDVGQKVVDDLKVKALDGGVYPVVTANAGPDQTVSDNDGNGSEAVQLDGSGSSVNIGAIAEYHWTEGSTVLYSGANATANVNLSVGTHNITLRATDGAGSSDTDDVLILVMQPSSGDCEASNANWQSFSMTAFTGVFTAEYDATPSGSAVDGLTCFSNGPAGGYADGAVIVRFNTSSVLDARNGTTYAADNAISYNAGQSYHFRLIVNITNHTYSVYVTPAGGSEQQLASNYAFRAEQSSVSQLDCWNISASAGSHDVCDMQLAIGGNQPPIAEAGPNQSLSDEDENGSESVALDGSGSSDPDGSISNYRWAEGASVLYNGPNATTNVTLNDGSHTLTLTVTDNGGAQTSDTVLVSVTGPGGTSMTSSVTQHGITWTFDKQYAVGQFVNGDYWVLGPVVVTAISPNPSGERNGSMVNPAPGWDHAYDGRLSYGYNSALAVTLPLTLNPNDSLVSTISNDDAATHIDVQGRSINLEHGYLRTAAVLTCLSSAPPADAFRPPYAGTYKPIYSASVLNTAGLPSLAPVSSTPALATYERLFERVWLDHKAGWTGRLMHPTDNMPNYGREIGGAVGDATLLLCLNFSTQQKQKLHRLIVQAGIDMYGMARIHKGVWEHGGGHGLGRRWLIVLAGQALNEPAFYQMQDYMSSEDSNTYFADSRGGPWTGWQNSGSPYASTAMWGMWHDLPAGHFPTGNGSIADHEHIHPSQWGDAPFPISSQYAYDKFEPYKRICAIAYVGQALSARIMGAKNLWNHDPFFAFTDRWMYEDDAAARAIMLQYWPGYSYSFSPPGGSAWSSFAAEMWNTYRGQY